MRSCSDTDRYSPRVVSQKSDSLHYCWKFKKIFTFNFFLVQFIAQSKGKGENLCYRRKISHASESF